MERLRCSVVQDIPRLRELWYLAFGDDGAYVDNFFDTYYKPERMLVLEEDGVVQAMTAWFDTGFVVPEEGSFRHHKASIKPGCLPGRTTISAPWGSRR